MATKRTFKSTHGITSQVIKGETKRKFFAIGEEIPEKHIPADEIKRYLASGMFTEVIKGSDGS